MQFISMDEYLMSRIKLEDLPATSLANLNTLIPKVNILLEKFGEYRSVVSGFRTPEINKTVGGGKKSCHLTCEAVDLLDKDGKLYKWCKDNVEVLEELGLYVEDKSYTPTWVHLQTRVTKRRFFIPY